MRRLISLLFFLSGLTGLLYEVLWAKHLALTLGSTAVGQTLTLALFMGGLALGNAWLGPRADRSANPLRLYAGLEAAIAALGLASPLLLELAGAAPSSALRALAAAAALLPPAALMGGTLPALSRLAAARPAQVRAAVSWLYFLNSAGAALGALIAGFWLLPEFGIIASIRFAALLNLGIAAGALALGRLPAPSAGSAPAAETVAERPVPRGLLLAVVFVSGFISLSYEVAWNRLLALVLGSSAYSFSLMLAAFIGGIALGSFLIALRRPRLDSYALLGWAELGVALSILAPLRLYDKLPWIALLLDKTIPRTPRTFYLYEGSQLLMCWLLMLAPTVFLGMTLPLAARAAALGARRVGRDVGRVFGLNTLGNVLGAAVSGLWLLPALGMERLIQAGAGANLLAAGAVLWTAYPRAPLRRKAALAGACLLAFAAQTLAPPWDRTILSNGPFRVAAGLRGLPSFRFSLLRDAMHHSSTLIYYQDGRESTVSVFQKDRVLWLKVNGKTDASSEKDMGTQVLMAHLPFLLRPAAKEALLIGLGSGVTAGSVLTHGLDRLDLAEISPAVRDASRLFDEINGRPLEDPRLRLTIADGKAFLRHSRRRWDLIISEPTNPWIAGVGNLFSEEFDREARDHLNPGGVVAQWFHLYEMSDDTLRMIVRTFCSVFPHVTLWQTHPYDIVLLGSNEPSAPDLSAAAAEFSSPSVKKDLERVGVGRFTTLLALQMASDPAVRAMAGSGPLNTDLVPKLEYQAPKAFFLDQESALPYLHDERPGPGARALPLADYLRRRGAPLSREELREIARFLGTGGTSYVLSNLEEWVRRFPEDAEARLMLAQARKDAGEMLPALAALKPVLARASAPAPALALGAELTSDPKEKLVLLERLSRLKDADRSDAFEKIARLYETESYEKAVEYLGKAAAAAGGDRVRAASLWTQGAIAAIQRYDVPLAEACARRALERNPEDQAARTMLDGLLRVRALDRENANP